MKPIPKYLEALEDAIANGTLVVDPVNGHFFTAAGKAIKPRQGDPKAYPTITIGAPKFGRRRFAIACHKIVAFVKFGRAAFEPGIQVRHKENDKTNFTAANLLLGTPTMNAYDKPKHVRVAMAKKARAAQGPAWNRKFSEGQVEDIRRLVRKKGDAAALARLLDVDKSTISKIVKGRAYPRKENP